MIYATVVYRDLLSSWLKIVLLVVLQSLIIQNRWISHIDIER